MAQTSNLLDLLADDEEEEEEENLDSTDFQALVRGSAAIQAPVGSAGGQAAAPRHGSRQQAPTQPPASQREAQGPAAPMNPQRQAYPVQLLLEWCKQNLPTAEHSQVLSAVRELRNKVAQGTRSPKEVYNSILRLIGPERMKAVKAFILSEVQKQNTRGSPARAAALNKSSETSTGERPASVLHQEEQRLTAQQAGVPRQPAHQASSIMQSLVYNAEQARQHQPGELTSPQENSTQQSKDPSRQREEPPRAPAARTGGPGGHDQVRPSLASLRPVSQQMSSNFGKHPAEAVLPAQPAAKRTRREKEEVEEENDVLKANSGKVSLLGVGKPLSIDELTSWCKSLASQDSGVNLEEEQSALLGTLEHSDLATAVAAPTVIPEENFLNQAPLGVKVLDIAKRHGLEVIDQQVGPLLSRAAEAHLGSLIERVFAMARQRTDADRARQGMSLAANLRRRLHEHNLKSQKDLEARQKSGAEPQVAAGQKRKQSDEEPNKRAEKAIRKETEKQQVSAANAAAAAAFGSKAQKWGTWSSEVGKRPAIKTGKALETEADAVKLGAAASWSGAARAAEHVKDPGRVPVLPPSRVKAEMLSAKLPDLVAVLERDPCYEKSSLLYKLHGQLAE